MLVAISLPPTATHRLAEAQATLVKLSASPTLVQVWAPPAGLVLTSSWPFPATTHSPVLGHAIALS